MTEDEAKRERARAYRKKYYEAHKEKLRAQNREYQRNYRRLHREEANARQRAHRQKQAAEQRAEKEKLRKEQKPEKKARKKTQLYSKRDAAEKAEKRPNPYEGLTGLTLPDALGKLEPDTLVYLGAAAGFFEIATAAEVTAELDELSQRLIGAYRRIARKRRQELLDMLDREPDHGEKLKSMAPGTWPDPERDVWLEVQKIFEKLKAQKPLRERTVREAYERRFFEPGAILIVEGTESGKLWFVWEKKEVEP